jgi:hypothetical protein
MHLQPSTALLLMQSTTRGQETLEGILQGLRGKLHDLLDADEAVRSSLCRRRFAQPLYTSRFTRRQAAAAHGGAWARVLSHAERPM